MSTQLPFLPQKLPQTQAEWQQALNILQQWQQQLNANSASLAVPTWTALPLSNSWVYWGAPFNTPAYYQDYSGRVFLRGLIKNGTATDGSQVAQLPFVPTNQYITTALGFNGSSYIPVRLDVTTTGQVVVFNFGSVSGTYFVSLDNLSYQTV